MNVRFGDRRGFSLFELIVVMLIVAIAGAMAVPAVTSGWQSRQIRQGTRKLAGMMRSLREHAVRRGVEQELVLDADGETLRWTDGPGTTLPESVTIAAVSGGWRDEDGSVRVIFYPNGGATGFSAIVAGRAGGGLQFAVDVEPLLGTVVIREVGG
jgi:general secretion pathway protein H